MELTYYGANCLHVATKNVNLLFDPAGTESGLKLPGNLKRDVTLYTQLQPEEAAGKDFAIALPGEYEIKDVSIIGVAAQLHTDTPEDPMRGIAYLVSVNDLRLLVLGNIDPKLTEDQLELLGSPHVVVVPVGGNGLTLDAEGAAGMVNQFEPRWVVPVHYEDGKTKYPLPQNGVELFLKELGQELPEPQAKLKASLRDLGEEGMAVVLLDVQG